MFKITETFKSTFVIMKIKYYTLNGFDCYTKKKGVVNV